MRRRFVKGKITKTTGGSHNMYSNGNIVTNAGGFIKEKADNQFTCGDPEDAPEPTAKMLINSVVNGYFYTKDGIYLGKIGIGNNVYITDQATFLAIQKGKTVADDKIIYFTEKYKLNNTQLLDRANWAYVEGGYKIPKFYTYSMENAFKTKYIGNNNESDLYKSLMKDNTGLLEKDKYFSGGYLNQTGKRFWILRNSQDKFTQDMINCVEAVISSKISPNDDPTGGTNAWLGYKEGSHTGEYYIFSEGSKHFFLIYGKSKKTNLTYDKYLENKEKEKNK